MLQRCPLGYLEVFMPIPFLDLVSLHRSLEDDLLDVVRRALRSAQFIGGPEVEAFEQEFAAYCGVPYCAGVGSGTDAVRFALTACGVGQGDAVVTVPHTFIATVEGISQAGAEPEFVDIDESSYNLSPQALAEYLSSCDTDPATGRPLGRRSGLPLKAVVPVHLYGQCADMDPLLELAERYGLLVVEDAAQAHGAGYRTERFQVSSFKFQDNQNPPETCNLKPETRTPAAWRRAGSFGHAAAFSFYPGKNLGACGEAGAVVSSDEEVIARVKMLRDHGQVRKYYHEVEGYNG
ncbi:MAG TPA: DegT/DnrJ/EryC1/StrS family aminotransferase, partial [Acidobacteriota bacterium]|nr:DegT/DnrJ/EryC1/StrS family aminotransferase [Acidobacteriota bacterium]